jgi:hypothetical protein
MLRKFEEIGATVAGIKVGLFDGEVEFDRGGHVVTIEVQSHDPARPLRLDIAELVRERVQLRRSHGVDFAEMGGRPAAYHAQKWYLFVTLSASLEKAFEDDIIAYLADLEDERGIA